MTFDKCMSCKKKITENVSYQCFHNEKVYLRICLDCWKDWQLWSLNEWMKVKK